MKTASILNEPADHEKTVQPCLTAVFPADVPDGHRLAYTIENLLRPFGFRINWRHDGQDSNRVHLIAKTGNMDSVKLPVEELRSAFARISGLAERQMPKDRLDRVREADLMPAAFGPDLSRWAMSIGCDLESVLAGWQIPRKPLTVHLTHDIDRVHPLDPVGLIRRLLVPTRGVPNTLVARCIDCIRWVNKAATFLPAIEQIMAAEQEVGAKATYFMMSGPYSYRKTGARTGDCRKSRHFSKITSMAEAFGHRVGLHGCAYSLERRDYARQSDAIAQVTAQPVTWHRNHYLVWDAQTSPRRLKAGGLLVDSTLGFNTLQSFRAGLAWPYELWDFADDAPAGVMEIPMVFMDAAGVIVEPGATWDALYAQLDEAEALLGEVAINFHPEYFIDRPVVNQGYRKLLERLGNAQCDLSSPTPKRSVVAKNDPPDNALNI